MSILASLAKAYDRMPDAPPFGYSAENIGFLISLNENGVVANIVDLRSEEGKKRIPRTLQVPASFKRPGVTPRPFFLWDNANYALGLNGNAEAEDPRFVAFREKHLEALKGQDDVGLLALARFLGSWRPENFENFGVKDDFATTKVAFALENERRETYLHDRPAAKILWMHISESWKAVEGKNSGQAVCLVSGEMGQIARTHPAIRGIRASAGAKDADSIVAFNQDSFESYGHEQGDNAQISEAVAFKYTTALNTLLAGKKNRIQIGDASTVFWADASEATVAEVAESAFGAMFSDIDETTQAGEVGTILKRMRAGQPLNTFAPELAEGVRFYVLGLAPNAARLSIRFWFEDDFGVLARNYQRFVGDMEIAPPPRDEHPALWKYLAETAVLGKRENVPPNLAGEWMRAILTGTSYPLTLLVTVLMRIRADGDVNGLRVGILKALLIRNFGKEAPVALDRENANKGYLLGRLFASYEQAQLAALGPKVNATIKDKFYGAASAQPRRVFALLEKGSANHLSKVGKQAPGYRVVLEKTIGGIMEQMSPAEEPFPASLSAQEQALFGLGYYHQRNDFFKSRKTETATQEEAAQ
jgi:CRISPR-associated protein Csd1